MEYSKLYQRVNVTGWENDPSPKTPLDADNLNNMDKGIDDLDNRILELNDAKSDRNEVASMFTDVSFDSSTGIITFTKYDGSKKQIDTMLEKVVTNFDFDEQTQKLTLTLEDGTIKEVDLSSFISEYEFEDSDTIVWEVVDHKVVASIRNHSIGADQLKTDYLANCEIAENNASNSASRAIDEALRSEGYSAGTQNGVPVDDPTSPFYHNNAKYYSDKAGTKTIASLDDVALSNVEEGQALVYDAENDKWVNGDAIPKYKLNAPTNVSATAQNESVVLKWTDPDDLILGENTLAEWVGTAIVQKIGSAPTSIEDGTPIYASMVRNQHSEVGYVVEGLENDTEYFFGVFPVSKERVANTSVVVSAIPEGNINPIKEWCQTIGLSYENLEDIPEADMRKLMSKHVSVDYFMEWYSADNSMLDAFTVNESAMKWIGLNDYICDKLLAIEDAESRLLASEYWPYILKDKVPIMTANDAPYGEAFVQSTYSGREAYKCFGNGGTTFGSSTNVSNGAYIGYSFVNPICVKMIELRSATSDVTQVVFQGTNDINGTWDDLGETSITFADGIKKVLIPNDKYYLHHRVYQKSSTDTNYFPMTLLQFYGRSLNVSVPVMTSNTSPWGVVTATSENYGTTGREAYKAFDKSTDTMWWGGNLPSITYEFKKSMRLKVISIDGSTGTTANEAIIVSNFECSIDGLAWEKITDDFSVSERKQMMFSTDKEVKFVRMNTVSSTMSGQQGLLLRELNFFGVDYSEPSENYRKMTAIIDLANSNPSTCVTYADDAIGMEKGSAEWDKFFGHYPCMLKDGEELGVLRRSDFSKWEFSNQNADITSGANGDVMIAFPRRGLSIKTVDDKVYISMTDNPNDSEFEYNAHTRGTDDLEKFYIGAHKGYVDGNNKLRSLSGKTITASKTIDAFRTLAQANGDGYEQSGFYPLTYRQAMYILKYGNLDSQSAVGMGHVNPSNTSPLATGGSETYGMDSEIIKSTNPTYMTDQEHHVKLFGIEDAWGNIHECVDGLVTDADRNILTANSNFNNSGIGYENNGSGGVSSDIVSFMSKPQGTTKTGFLTKEVNGSESTYFCDACGLYDSSTTICGGHWRHSNNAGIFKINADVDNISYSVTYVGARLMYLKKGVI